MEEHSSERLPECIWGDGCLLRLTDGEHDENYVHTVSKIKKCPHDPCPLYQRAYDFVVGSNTSPSKEDKEAHLHASQYYHPPPRSKSVFRERPDTRRRSSSDHRSSNVPKLDLEAMKSSQHISSSLPSQIKSAPTTYSFYSHQRPKPEASKITITPKKRSSSVSSVQLDMIQRDIEDMKTSSLQTNVEVLSMLRKIQKDVEYIKSVLGVTNWIPNKDKSPRVFNTVKYYSSDDE